MGGGKKRSVDEVKATNQMFPEVRIILQLDGEHLRDVSGMALCALTFNVY